jgi:hypothetical protein
MKFNKWTVGLAAVGVVSLASAARADEKAMNAVQTAVAGTTISGYVDVSAQWNLGTGNNYVAPVKFQNTQKADGFNLNVVQLTIAKPLDESEWAAGYHVDLWFGPDADVLGTRQQSNYGGYLAAPNFAVRQAYVALRLPVGNGIDLKVGAFDSPIGYESVESGNNPNFTRSYGHSIEPQTMTGVLATYRFADVVAASVGVANTVGPMINQRAFYQNSNTQNADGRMAESYKTYMGSIALTAPESLGWIAGSTLYAGVVNGFNEGENPYGNNSNIEEPTTSYYVGATLATPVTGLKFGAAMDYLQIAHWGPGFDHEFAVALYASLQATEKLSLHLRGEYWDDNAGLYSYNQFYAVTATAQYDLWKNVISRIEFRWDHAAHYKEFGGNPNTSIGLKENAFMLAANIIYKF